MRSSTMRRSVASAPGQPAPVAPRREGGDVLVHRQRQRRRAAVVGELAHHHRRSGGSSRPSRRARSARRGRGTPCVAEVLEGLVRPTCPRRRGVRRARRAPVRRPAAQATSSASRAWASWVSINVVMPSIVPNRGRRASRISELIQYEIWTPATARRGYVGAHAGLRQVLSRLDGRRGRRRPVDAADPARADPRQHPVQRHRPRPAGHLPVAAGAAAQAPRTQGRARALAVAPAAAAASTT